MMDVFDQVFVESRLEECREILRDLEDRAKRTIRETKILEEEQIIDLLLTLQLGKEKRCPTCADNNEKDRYGAPRTLKAKHRVKGRNAVQCSNVDCAKRQYTYTAKSVFRACPFNMGEDDQDLLSAAFFYIWVECHRKQKEKTFILDDHPRLKSALTNNVKKFTQNNEGYRRINHQLEMLEEEIKAVRPLYQNLYELKNFMTIPARKK